MQSQNVLILWWVTFHSWSKTPRQSFKPYHRPLYEKKQFFKKSKNSITRDAAESVHFAWSSLYLQRVFFNCSSRFSVSKWKTSWNQWELLVQEILNIKQLLVGSASFFIILGAEKWKDHPLHFSPVSTIWNKNVRTQQLHLRR